MQAPAPKNKAYNVSNNIGMGCSNNNNQYLNKKQQNKKIIIHLTVEKKLCMIEDCPFFCIEK